MDAPPQNESRTRRLARVTAMRSKCGELIGRSLGPELGARAGATEELVWAAQRRRPSEARYRATIKMLSCCLRSPSRSQLAPFPLHFLVSQADGGPGVSPARRRAAFLELVRGGDAAALLAALPEEQSAPTTETEEEELLLQIGNEDSEDEEAESAAHAELDADFPPCPFCKLTSFLRTRSEQTRSLDEGATVFCWCVNKGCKGRPAWRLG